MDGSEPGKHWKNMLVSRENCEQLLLDARVELADEWQASREAVLLSLANTLTRAVRRQVKALSTPREPTPAEYRRVATLARKFQALVESLQDTNDPPPLLQLDDRGRNAWERWETGEQLNPEGRGAPTATEKTLLLELVALRQLVTGSEAPGFTRGESAPLPRFLAASFDLARKAYLSLAEKPGDRQAHSLVAPSEEALVKHRDRAVDLKICRDLVAHWLEKYRSMAANGAGQGK